MARQLIVKNTYIPKVGEGKALLAALREAQKAWVDAGFPGLELWKCFHGPHNAVTTIQRWNSIGEWEAAREKVVATPSMVTVVFDVIYPTNAVAYDTELFELMD
ncbi:MAG TPA: hypothetical protein VIA06_06710 [Candidatus Dormibacteraeota bacterium]|jgi:hypothetical protein|nr:hypothetical protein [Candidatus Dormibacteraeota bacterium]